MQHTQYKYLKKRKVIGWRENASLPDLCIDKIKVKIDSGAKTSTLHAEDIVYFKKKGSDWVRFNLFPEQGSKNIIITCESKILEKKAVKSSSGHISIRPLIETTIDIGNEVWTIKLTLVDRAVMGFRMLLGRDAVKKRFLIHAGKSFLLSKNVS